MTKRHATIRRQLAFAFQLPTRSNPCSLRSLNGRWMCVADRFNAANPDAVAD